MCLLDPNSSREAVDREAAERRRRARLLLEIITLLPDKDRIKGSKIFESTCQIKLLSSTNTAKADAAAVLLGMYLCPDG